MSKYDKPQTLTIVRCGLRSLISWNVPMRSLSLWHLYVNDSCGSKLVYKDRQIEIPANIPVLIPPHTLFATKMDTPMQHFYIDFQMNFPQFDNMLRKEIFLEPFSIPKIMPGKLELFALLLKIFSQLPVPQLEENIYDDRFDRIIELLECGEEDFDVVCYKVGISRRTGERIFHRNSGLTPRQYIENRRMNMAYNQIIFTKEPIDKIAKNCGYADRYHFSKCFKKIFSISPALFRELHDSDDPYPDKQFCNTENHYLPQTLHLKSTNDQIVETKK